MTRNWRIFRTIAVAAFAVAGCHRGRETIRIDVAQRDGGLVFKFGLCDRADVEPRITKVEIVRKGADEAHRNACGMYMFHGGSFGSAVRYGEAREGVTTRGCGPLVPGTYVAWANAEKSQQRTGYREFTVDGDGRIQQVQTNWSCGDPRGDDSDIRFF
jgi:hypothetical protein